MGLLPQVACSNPFQVSDSLGEWEGVAAMIETGSASFEFDCARGASMSLEVDIIPRDVTAGPYQFRRDQGPVLRKCL